MRTRFAAYGNEPEIGFSYQRICMLVDVEPPGARASGVCLVTFDFDFEDGGSADNNDAYIQPT